MEKRLAELVTIEENNIDCVVLKVKENAFMDLIKLGCFNGDESLIKLTKGSSHTCTMWHSDGNTYSWDWGIGGDTIVTKNMRRKAAVIQKCIEYDFGIIMEGNDINTTLNVKSLKNRTKQAIFKTYKTTDTHYDFYICLPTSSRHIGYLTSDEITTWLEKYGWKIDKEEGITIKGIKYDKTFGKKIICSR